MTFPDIDLKLPYITDDIPGIGGEIKLKPHHFIVEEVPLYYPEGSGEHLYINITKENKTTREIQLKFAELFKLRPHDVGRAGLKDKNSISTQTFSILLQNYKEPIKEIKKIIEENLDIKVNWANYHRNKLRIGHLLGNKFTITISNLEKSIKESDKLISKITAKIHDKGIPNFYGVQRTGIEGENILSGWKILQGKKRVKNKWLRRYLVSSYQSYLCNKYLTERIKRGLFNNILNGDIAKKHDTGGLFWVTDPYEAQKRFEAKEISFTAPIYGYKMSEAKNLAKNLEDEVFKRSKVSIVQLKKHKVTGTRRLARIIPQISSKQINDNIILKFSLPKGSFATIILREYMKNDL